MFVVTRDFENVYGHISENIKDSKVAVAENDADNIVNIISMNWFIFYFIEIKIIISIM